MCDIVARNIRIDPQRPERAAIREAVAVLRGGGLVAFPTETVYGLGARALDENAVLRVFAAKGRPARHPLIAHVADEGEARRLARSWPDSAARLARSIWPGPLTLVVDRAAAVPPAVSGGADSIAIRAPAHPVALELIAALGEPLAAPSANRFQGVSPTRAEHVLAQLGHVVELVLDAGPCEAGIESTVVDVRGPVVQVLRPGALPLAALRRLVDVEFSSMTNVDDSSRPSPGMDSRHYAPRAQLLLADTRAQAFELAQDLASKGRSVGLVIRETPTVLPATSIVLCTLPSEPVAYGRGLYAALHELDAKGVNAIVVERAPRDESWWAVADRLERASTGR
jgi:L-threonylcarbamoyladenylate synthase